MLLLTIFLGTWIVIAVSGIKSKKSITMSVGGGFLGGCCAMIAFAGVFNTTGTSNKSAMASSSIQKPTPKPKNRNDDLQSLAFRMAQNYETKVIGCDKMYGFKLVNPKYGVITHDQDNYQPFKLNTPVKAIMTGVEFTCQDNKRGTKNKSWVYLVGAVDKEFDRFRCTHVTSATEYASDGNTPLKYNPDKSSYSGSPRSIIESDAQECGFKSNA